MKRLNQIRTKITALTVTGILLYNKYVYADVVEEVNGGGEIQSSALGKGLMNMIKDLTGTLQWILPVVGVCVALWYLFKIMTGDEQDQQRYKKGLLKIGICIIGGLVAVTIINLIAKYFGK